MVKERVELYLYSPYGPYGLYRASVPVQRVHYILYFYCLQEVSSAMRKYNYKRLGRTRKDSVFPIFGIKIKVKVTIQYDMKIQRRVEIYISALSLTSALDKGGWSTPRPPPAALPPGKDPVPTIQEAGLATGPAWTGEENLASTGMRSSNGLTRSESLYRLSHSGPVFRAPS